MAWPNVIFAPGRSYLSDDPEFGACPGCCTPEALQRAEATLAERDETIAALTADKSLPELLDELDGVASQVRDRMAELEAAHDEREAAHDEREAAMAEIEPATRRLPRQHRPAGRARRPP